MKIFKSVLLPEKRFWQSAVVDVEAVVLRAAGDVVAISRQPDKILLIDMTNERPFTISVIDIPQFELRVRWSRN